jgi:hypothetical protein
MGASAELRERLGTLYSETHCRDAHCCISPLAVGGGVSGYFGRRPASTETPVERLKELAQRAEKVDNGLGHGSPPTQ